MKIVSVLLVLVAIIWYLVPVHGVSGASFEYGKTFIIMNDGHSHRFGTRMLSALLLRDYSGDNVDWIVFQVFENSTAEERYKDRRMNLIDETYTTLHPGNLPLNLSNSHIMLIARGDSVARYSFRCTRSALTPILHYKAKDADDFFKFVLASIPNQAL
jgi:hypothetical protein